MASKLRSLTSDPAPAPPTGLRVTADAGRQPGAHLRLRKLEPQRLADATGLEIDLPAFPPGTSKGKRKPSLSAISALRSPSASDG